MKTRPRDEKKRQQIVTVFVYLFLTIGSMFFVSWIARMAYENTGIELQEQYIVTQTKETVNLIENSIDFGKELSNFYGMDGVLADVVSIKKNVLHAAVTDENGKVLYVSSEFQKSSRNIKILSEMYGNKYQKQLSGVTKEEEAGTLLQLGSHRSLVFPIFKADEGLSGYLIVFYEKASLIQKTAVFSIYRVIAMIALGVGAFLFFCLVILKDRIRMRKKTSGLIAPLIMVLGVFVFVCYLYGYYRYSYRELIGQNAKEAAEYISDSVDKLEKKGLHPEKMKQVADYLDGMAEGNESINSIYIVKPYFDSTEYLHNLGDRVVRIPVSDSGTVIDVEINQEFISKKLQMMTLSFGAIIIICLMITYEMTHLADVISLRMHMGEDRNKKEELKGIGAQIKLFSFLSYTAIYASMPYAAVIMRNWDVSVLGFSKTFSASLPLTVELLCIMVFSIVIQKIFKDSHLKRLMFLAFPLLVLGNAACMFVSSPYILIGLRAFCGIGFAFLKYWLNAYVAAGSETPEEVRTNFAQLNGGLLGGITAGASLGSVLAQSLGYLSNYMFTAILCTLVLLSAWFFIPWKTIGSRRAASKSEEDVAISYAALFRKPAVLKAILLGDVPLNIGLMYVVAFLPVYMDMIGKPAIVTSYAYLINGVAGMYIGVFLIMILKWISPKKAASFSLLMGAAGILILVAGKGTGIVLLSAGIMGLFDGYGTPTITSFFTALPEVSGADTASMLTVFSSVGSAVQILCPALYNVLIQPDGSTLYLLIFGIIFAAIGIVFPWMFQSTSAPSQGRRRKG